MVHFAFKRQLAKYVHNTSYVHVYMTVGELEKCLTNTLYSTGIKKATVTYIYTAELCKMVHGTKKSLNSVLYNCKLTIEYARV